MTRQSNGARPRPARYAGRALNSALDFEDDGASFRVRQERRTHIRQQPPRAGGARHYFRTMTLGRALALIFFGLPLGFLAFAVAFIVVGLAAGL